MKTFKTILGVLTLLSFFLAVTCFILVFVMSQKGSSHVDFWPAFIPSGIILLLNTMILGVVYGIILRLEEIERGLLKHNINVDEKEEVIEEKPQHLYECGEPVKLNKDLTLNNKQYPKDSEGTVVKIIDEETFLITFFEDKENSYEIKAADLKSSFSQD